MNFQQQKAIDIALEGHNLVLLGAAGTGKSFVMKKLADSLMKSGKKVQITCSTGIACSVYENACTIHQFTGISDGRHDPGEIVDVIRNNRKYEYVVQHVMTTDTIIVDECSMISKRILDTINNVCKMKDPNRHFGGMQVIFCGDFLQLPPVANISYGDDGKYCFESEDFGKCFPHRVVLSETLRQSDKEFVNVIKEVYDGNISPESEDFIMNLKRSVDVEGSQNVKLFSRNDFVDDYNRKCIMKFPGDVYEYKSKDYGKITSLTEIPAPHIIWLKIGCPVILLRNISNKLVNGLKGFVQDIQEGLDPVIEFPSIALTTTIPKIKFTVYSPKLNTDIAVREQYPLKLAFGLTIHKAQGMTLDRAEVDCREIFRAGQLGVAISRVRTSAGLRVLNYHPRYIIPPPQSVRDFMDQTSKATSPDLDCCRESRATNSYSNVEPKGTDMLPEEDSSNDIEDVSAEGFDEEFDDEFDAVINQITADEAALMDFDIPEHFDIDNVMENMIFKKEVTQTQSTMNKIIREVDRQRLCTFVKKIFAKCSSYASKLTPGKTSCGVPEKNIAQFYHLLHKFSTSAEYNLNCLMLFENEDFSENHMMVCYNLVEAVRVFFLKEKVELLKIGNSNITERHVTDASRARVRYVAGYCLASLRKKYVKMQRSHMYDKTKQGQDMYIHAKWVVFVLNLLKENEYYLKSHTAEPDSLIDIERRQCKSRGLTNVNDSLFKFFVNLTGKCMSLLVHKNLMKFGKNMYNKCLDLIKDDLDMYEQFCKVVVISYSEQSVEEFDDSSEVNGSVDKLVHISSETCKIYYELTEKYLLVLLSQFRKDVKSAFRIEKTMAHRKQIKVSKKHECEKPPAIKKSKQQKGNENPQSSESEVAPLTLMKDSDQQGPKPGLSSQVSDLDILCQVQPEQEEQPGPSSQDLGSDTDDICQSCFRNKKDQWIQCDSCNSWFHRKCAGLKNNSIWKKISKEGVSWFCHTCK